MKILLTLVREIFEEDRTLGHLYIDGKPFCWTLEDVVRPKGVKIDRKTAIPTGTYKLAVNMSNKFKRLIVQLLNVPMFEGIRIHGGNNPEDTEGCILVAFNHKGKDKKTLKSIIFGTAEKQVFDYIAKAIKKEEDVWITISNKKI